MSTLWRPRGTTAGPDDARILRRLEILKDRRSPHTFVADRLCRRELKEMGHLIRIRAAELANESVWERQVSDLLAVRVSRILVSWDGALRGCLHL